MPPDISAVGGVSLSVSCRRRRLGCEDMTGQRKRGRRRACGVYQTSGPLPAPPPCSLSAGVLSPCRMTPTRAQPCFCIFLFLFFSVAFCTVKMGRERKILSEDGNETRGHAFECALQGSALPFKVTLQHGDSCPAQSSDCTPIRDKNVKERNASAMTKGRGWKSAMVASRVWSAGVFVAGARDLRQKSAKLLTSKGVPVAAKPFVSPLSLSCYISIYAVSEFLSGYSSGWSVAEEVSTS